MDNGGPNVRYRTLAFWVLSLAFHLVLCVVLAMTGWTIAQAGPADEFEAGIMVRRTDQKRVVFEDRDRRVRAPDAVQPEPDRPAEEVPAEDLEDLLKEDTQFDPSAVPSAVDVLTDATQIVAPGAIGDVPPGFGKTSFFGREAIGSKFVYVLDRSYSMEANNALGWAKEELIRSLAQLPSTARFHIIFYNDEVYPIIVGGESKLAYATPEHKRVAERRVNEIRPSGGTEHVRPVKRAIAVGADVIFFLTDADAMSRKEADEITRTNRTGARIHCIEFGIGVRWTTSNNLQRVALDNGGTYRYVNTSRFRRRPMKKKAEGRP